MADSPWLYLQYEEAGKLEQLGKWEAAQLIDLLENADDWAEAFCIVADDFRGLVLTALNFVGILCDGDCDFALEIFQHYLRRLEGEWDALEAEDQGGGP
jgi:hypothetical protein